MTRARRLALPFALAAVAAAVIVVAARQPPPSPADAFTVRDEMIPMRDGVKLYTRIFTPKNQSGPLPFVFRRTPYGIDGADGSFVRYYKALADEGYIFVFQDIRGKFKSEGTFVMQRPARAPGDTTSLDEGTDTYDTIEWLLKNVPNHNGRVGMLGVSYDGWTTIMGALEPHPALKAISPQASPSDMWLGDDFHHNGAFRLSYAFEYATMMESGKDVKNFEFDRYDTFDWYLSLGPLSAVNRRFLRESIPTWNDYVRHPDYDEFWKRQTLIPHLRGAKVPTLNVAGWWDQEDFYGPLDIYASLEKHDSGGAELPGRRPVEPRRLDRQRHVARPDPVRQRHGGLLPRPGAGAVLRLLPEGQGHARLPRGAHLRERRQPVAALEPVAAGEGDEDRRPLLRRQRGARRGCAARRRARPATTATSPIRRTRCRTGSGRSRPPTSPAARSGRRGWSKTSASSTTAPTCSAGRRRRSRAMSPSPARWWRGSSRRPPAPTPTGSSSSSTSIPSRTRRTGRWPATS